MSAAAAGGAAAAGEVVRPRADVAMVEIDGEGVVYDRVAERVHLLNPSATLVWSLLDGVSSLAELAAALAPATGLEEDVLLDDLVALVARLRREGLLEPVPAATITAPRVDPAAGPSPT